MKKGKCKFCGRPNEGNAGDHYHYHRCWQQDVRKRMDNAKPEEMKKLRREMELARYVGD